MLFLASRQLFDSTSFLEEGNSFQNRRVWSPEPVRMLSSSGDLAIYRTLYECPSSVASFCMLLAFHTMIELREKPWVVTSSLVVEENSMLHTCDPESVFFMQFISLVFHSLIDLSVDPPPVASRELLWGDQARAFTAAVCYVNLPKCRPILGSQIRTKLSFPPVAISPLSQDHFSPHISCSWPSNLMQASLCLVSQMIIQLSLEPEAISLPLIETSRTPTLPR